MNKSSNLSKSAIPIINTNEEKLKKALKLEGFLKKQSPSITKSYQLRYFKIMDNGRTLGYANSKEDFNRGEKIKGQIPIKDVKEVIDISDKPLKFHIVTPERTYKIEADSREKKLEWIEAIRICQEHAIEQDRQLKERLHSEELEIRIDKGRDDGGRGSYIFKPFSFVAKTAKSVFIDTAINKTVTAVKSGVQALDDLAFDNTPKSNDQYLLYKGYKEYLDLIDQRVLNCRIMMGFLNEEHKEVVGNSLVNSLVNDSGLRNPHKKRWLMLISKKPIIPELTDPNDDEILNANFLPEGIETETLYWYDFVCNNSRPYGSIKMDAIQEIVIREKINTEQFYRFLLDLGDKKHFFTTPFLTEMEKWVVAIQASRATSRELSKSRLSSYKNISVIVRLHDSQDGPANLKAKITNDFNELMGKSDFKDLTKFLEALKAVATEYTLVINSCICQREKRFDIIKVYAAEMHESLCKSLRNYFQAKGASLTVPQLLEIVYFFFWYRDELKKISNVFIDDKIIDSAALMSSIITRRIVKYNLGLVNQLLRNEMDNPPNDIVNGRLASSAPKEFLQILNETIIFYENCKTSDMAECLLEACNSTTQYYQDGLVKTMTENNSMTPDQYAAICNNITTIKKLCKEFSERAMKFLYLTEEKAKKNFNCEELDELWDCVAGRAHERLAETSFRGLDNIIYKFSLLDINFVAEFNKGLGGIPQNINKIEPQYQVCLYYDALKKCVRSFTKSLIFSLEKKKIKKIHHKKILERLRNLIDELTKMFKDKVNEEDLTDQLANFINFEEFFKIDYIQLPAKCQFMKETYGEAFTWTHLKLLITIKEDQIPEKVFKHVMDHCKAVFQQCEKTREKNRSDLFQIIVEENKNDENAGTNHQNGDLIEEKALVKEEKVLEMKNPKKVNQSDCNGSNATLKKVIKTNLFGYLSMNKDDGIISTFDTKYIILRKDKIYYYKSRDSEKAEGNIPFTNVKACEPHHKEILQFVVKLAEDKQIRFKTETIEEKSNWIEAICELMKGKVDKDEIETDEIFYTDNTPLLKIEEKPNLAFNYDILKKMKNTGQLKVQNIMEASKPLKMSLTNAQNQNNGCCPCLRRNRDNLDYERMP